MTDAGRLCPACQTPIPADARVCPSCGAISLPGTRGTLGEAVALKLSTALGNRYRVEREIGEGGMAVVYLAHDLRHDRRVALKVLRPELSAYLGAERFLREIRIAAQLNHPHIVALHDSGEADGLLFYVMPFVEGESLRQRLGRQGPLDVGEAVTLAAEVADGLSYAHGLGVVHRDIKPENILLAHGHAAIVDFGIARAVAGTSPTITGTGMSPGTPIYMSPEQAAGDHALDHRTDIYSLGCMLYEMLTGGPPYAGATMQALVVQHAVDPVPSPRAARPDVPEALDAAIRRALAKAPADRFQTAAEFRAALGGLATVPGARPMRPRGARLARPRRLALATAGVLAVAALAAVLIVRHRSPAPRSVPSRAPLRVVVRPLEDRSGRLGLEAVRVTEALTDRLQAVPALAVTAAAAVADLRGASLDALRARFAPDRLVVGYLDEAGDSVRASVQIVDPVTATALASDQPAARAGAGAVAAVAESLSAFVRLEFSAELERAERRAQVQDTAAWSLVERAREQRDDADQAILVRLDRQGFRALDVADSLLQVAGRRDEASDLVPMDRARVADAQAFYVEYLRQVMPTVPGTVPDPQAERVRALGILNGLIRSRHGPAEAFELRGRIEEGLFRTAGVDSLLEAAVADYRAATVLDRHRATAWQALGTTYLSAGQYADALLASQRAIEEDVFQLHRGQLLRSRFDAALGAQEFDVADSSCRAGRAEPGNEEMFADCPLQLWSRTRSDRRSAAAGQGLAESLAARSAGTVIVPLRQLWVADILARARLGDSADRVAHRAVAGLPAAWLPVLLPECAYLRLLRADPDSAVTLVRAAVRLDSGLRRHFRTAPWYRQLAGDPRFKAAVAAGPPESATARPASSP